MRIFLNRMQEQIKEKRMFIGLYIFGLLLSVLFLSGISWLISGIL